VHPPPSPTRANFTLMTECAPESRRYYSVYSVFCTLWQGVGAGFMLRNYFLDRCVLEYSKVTLKPLCQTLTDSLPPSQDTLSLPTSSADSSDNFGYFLHLRIALYLTLCVLPFCFVQENTIIYYFPSLLD
jgi:hypothetical protein